MTDTATVIDQFNAAFRRAGTRQVRRHHRHRLRDGGHRPGARGQRVDGLRRMPRRLAGLGVRPRHPVRASNTSTSTAIAPIIRWRITGAAGLPRRQPHARAGRQDRRGARIRQAALRMPTIDANGVALGIESFGDDDAPLVLLAGGTTMLSWPDALCERLAAGGRRVVRYDLRDSGESTTADPDAPAYTLRDLAADAAALADALGGGPAHLAGIGVSGMVAQVAALDHPGAFSALTLVGTRAVAPGRPDDDLPDHDQATMKPAVRAADARLDRPRGGGGVRRRPGARSSATTPSRRARSPRASGTARPSPPRRSRWPTRWAWCSPSSTARPAGASACPRSRSPRSSSTAAATRSSPSATARRSALRRFRAQIPGCDPFRVLREHTGRRSA